MDAAADRMKKDFRQFVEVDRLEKRVESLEAGNRKLRGDLRALKRELAGVSRKVESLGPGGQKAKATPLIEIIEEMMKGRRQPMKVVDIREKLLKDDRVHSKAENFYAVIATAMNNSARFEKAGPGLYRYTGGK